MSADLPPLPEVSDELDFGSNFEGDLMKFSEAQMRAYAIADRVARRNTIVPDGLWNHVPVRLLGGVWKRFWMIERDGVSQFEYVNSITFDCYDPMAAVLRRSWSGWNILAAHKSKKQIWPWCGPTDVKTGIFTSIDPRVF